MQRDMEQRDKTGRVHGTPRLNRDAPSREDVDTSSVRHTLSHGRQPEAHAEDTEFIEQSVSGGDSPPLSRHGQDRVSSGDRGASSLRFGQDRGLRQPDGETRKKPLRMERKDGPAADAHTQDGAPQHEDGPARQPRLQFTKDETPPGRERDVVSDKAKAARRRVDKTDAKLEKAREKLPKTHRPHVEKTFDEKRGKMKKRLVFEEEVKSRHAHLKGVPVVRPVNAAKNTVIGYGHKKMHEVEHENVGTEAAHKGELMAEGGLRTAYRRYKTKPYRRMARLEKKAPRLRMKADYKEAVAANPKLQSNIFSRRAQKRKIKRKYAKMAREARKSGQRVKKAVATTEKIIASVVGFVKSHPAVFITIGILALLLIIIMTSVSSCSSMAVSTMGAVGASSYLAEDADIDNAELSYTEWETDLQIRIANAESEFPGYDEYRYSVDDIGHGAYELMAYLTARYQEFTFAGVQAELRSIFDEQYSLAFTPEVEIRTRMVTYYDEFSNPYEVEEEYEWHILNVTLAARSFTDMVGPRMDAEQTAHYEVLMRVKGNRQYSGSPFEFNWLPYISDGYGYRIHPIRGGKDYHKAVDIAVAAGTEIHAGHDGTVTFAGENGGYGLVVVLEGKDGLVTKYAHCSQLLVSQGDTVKMGDIIAKVGSTGDSTGAHLHFEVLKNGQYLNPLYFAITNDDGSSYIPPGSPGGVDIPAYPGEAMGDGSYAALMEEATKHLGKPYVFGAKGPDSFDCSSFVCWSLSKSGVYQISTTAQGLYNACTPVSRENVRPGDLIFFTGTYNAGRPVTHVGIYIGNGQMIHAGSPVQYASIDTPYWTQHFYAFGRLPVG